MSSVPCVIYRDALTRARQAYDDNRADHAKALQDAGRFRSLLYQATQADPGATNYALFQEIRAWADAMYNLARAGQNPTLPQQYPNAPGNIPGWASSLFSMTVNRANTHAAEPALRQDLAAAQWAYDNCIQQWQQNHPQNPPEEGGEEPAPPEGGEAPAPAEEGAAVGGYASSLCLAPRTGHGHEGEPCRIPLGEDGTCQHHGFRRDTSFIA